MLAAPCHSVGLSPSTRERVRELCDPHRFQGRLGGGQELAIVHTGDGRATWTPLASGESAFFLSAASADARDDWAVGDLGAMVRAIEGGATWGPQDGGTSESLQGITVSGGVDAWAAGAGAVRAGADLCPGRPPAPASQPCPRSVGSPISFRAGRTSLDSRHHSMVVDLSVRQSVGSQGMVLVSSGLMLPAIGNLPLIWRRIGPREARPVISRPSGI